MIISHNMNIKNIYNTQLIVFTFAQLDRVLWYIISNDYTVSYKML